MPVHPAKAGEPSNTEGDRLALWPIIRRVYNEFSADRIPTVAGGITFFVLLALFPAIFAMVSVFGLFAHHTELTRQVDLLSGFLPGGAVTVLRAELHRLAGQKATTLNVAFIVGFVVALWSASGGFKALVEGLNVAFEVKETRGFLAQTINALVFTVAGIVLGAIAIAISLTIPDHLPAAWTVVVTAASWPALFVGSALMLAVIYRFGPDRPHPKWRWITSGSAIASLLWVIGTQAFSWYAEHFGSYNRVYGDLGAVVGFLTWVWLSLVILLLGAEINCELERKSDLSGVGAGKNL
jgi:membrane protein